MEKQIPIRWPDFTKDNAAWALAKFRLGPDASPSDVADLAEQIKREEL